MASSSALNLEVIAKAIDQHNRNCPVAAVEVQMNPFEVDRLGWDEIKGLPIVGNEEIGTGRFRVICGALKNRDSAEAVEAVSADVGREVEVVREKELVTA